MPDAVVFLGRLHPALVHLPIGFVLLLGLLEILSRFRRFKGSNGGAGTILALAVGAAVLAAAGGWLLSLSGGYQERVLQWHKWTGLFTAAGCCLAALLFRLELRKLYWGCLFLTVAALMVTSHFGGTLTHGTGYLLEYAPKPGRAWLTKQPLSAQSGVEGGDLARKNAYATAVEPVLHRYCIACHGPEKAKAGLRLDTLEFIMKGGDAGAVLLAGRADESLLIKRLLLPAVHEDHMPPDGKPQPEPDEVMLLKWWIDAGADGEKSIEELKASLPVRHVLEARSREQ